MTTATQVTTVSDESIRKAESEADLNLLWEFSPGLRQEFQNNKGSFTAYSKALQQGRAKVFGQS